MEKQIKSIYYITTGDAEKEKTISVYRCGRSYLYAGRKPSVSGNPVAAGEMQIFFSILPENIKAELRGKRRYKKWLKKLKGAISYAEKELGCTDSEDILFSEELCSVFGRKQQIPKELYGVFLWICKKNRSFSHISIKLPEEHGFLLRESVRELLEPYLAGVNRVTFVGKETEGTMELEDYFYHEYGIVADYGNSFITDSVFINLDREAEMLKLLDTVVKTGYNTKVN